ncbi:MAG: hypothetical protein K6E92_10355 [Lachnospiraceae bacterium]|nr:hypothetical protein [Lachnospiraceae bacterium]
MKVTEYIEILSPSGDSSQEVVAALADRLRAYRPPAEVTEKTGIRSIRDVKEHWLIVLCMPETKEDASVRSRITGWIAEYGRNRILTLLVQGTPRESFPDELLFETLPDGSVVEHEPLAANITAKTLGQALGKLKVERLRLLAPMFGVTFDELRNRKKRRQRAILASILGTVLLGSAVFLGYAFTRMHTISEQGKQEAAELEKAAAARDAAQKERDDAKISLAESIAIQAQDALAAGDSELALLIALSALPDMQEAEPLRTALSDALNTRCADGYVPLTTLASYKRTRGSSESGQTGETQTEETVPLEELFPELASYGAILEFVDCENYILACEKDAVSVYQKDPFTLLYTIRDFRTERADCIPVGTYWNDVYAARLEAGEERLLIGERYGYDLATGDYLYELEDYGMGIGSRHVAGATGPELTVEDLLPNRVGEDFCMIDLRDGQIVASIHDPQRGLFTLLGETDPVTGRLSMKVVSLRNLYDSCSEMVWLYQEEAIPVPEDLDAQITLAKELLGGRTLTDKEKRENGLE